MRPHHGRLRSLAAYLALGAMMLQLLLFFGHVHARDVVVRPDGSSGWTRLAGAQLSDGSPSALADDNDLCAICFSASLLRNSFVPDAPELVFGHDVSAVDRQITRAGDIAHLLPHGPFQPRAPPTA